MGNFASIPKELVIAIIVVLVVLFVVGIIKKLLWMWVVAAILGVGLLFAQPTQLENMKENIVEMFGGSVDPLSDYNYSEEAEELDDELNITDELDKYSK